jgi:hypothetical protein
VRSFAPCIVFGALWLAGCGAAPRAYPPPVQRPAEAGPQRDWRPALIDMADPECPAYILGGMREFAEGDGWRWTHARPELRFWLDRADGWRFRVDFRFPAANFRATGPVTVSVFINGKLLDKVPYETPESHFIEKPVPAEWLRAGEETRVVMEIDPPWLDPGGAEKLGFVLYRVGFVR